MSIEQTINYQLSQYPGVKRGVKKAYQELMYLVSDKVQAEGEIARLSPSDPNHEYFFGYYDKSPWDAVGRYVICMRARDTWSDVSPKESADILLIDTEKTESDTERVHKIAETKTWNVQQGCMAQWLGPDFQSRIIYNDYRKDQYVSVVLDIETGKERILDAPVYAVSSDGSVALTLDFSRLYNLRPGYGYYNVPEKTQNIPLPDATAVWKIDIESGHAEPILAYRDFVKFKPRPEMLASGTVHKVNHLMIRPDGKRFLVLYRWFAEQRKYTRLITADMDGSDMYLLSDDDMVSHCFWKNNSSILAFENKKKEGPGYFLMKDKTDQYVHCWQQITNDGHPSYSPDGNFVVTDSYPDRKRMAAVKIMNGHTERDGFTRTIARVHAPFKYDNDTRCDLHPRWDRAGSQICFDSVHEGHRGVYCVKAQLGRKIKIVFLLTSCKKSGPVRQMLYIIKNLDRESFCPVLVTLYEEEKDNSMLKEYELYMKHFRANVSKTDIIAGYNQRLIKILEQIKPDIVHSLGVFPDYVMSRIRKCPHIMTLRNYIWEDYPAKFGKVQGNILALMHIYAMKHAEKTVTCSKSLSEIYRKKLHYDFDFVRNGADLTQYSAAEKTRKMELRKQLGLSENAVIFIYSGQLIERKNPEFLLQAFQKACKDNTYKEKKEEIYLLMLGAGTKYEYLCKKYGDAACIDFRGNVDNVKEFLNAGDIYVSASKSEGMPNGVLEAIACGLPVLLSDIPQHLEILELDKRIGVAYRQDIIDDLIEKIQDMAWKCGMNYWERNRFHVERTVIDAKEMSREYQKIYKSICII